MELVLKDSPFPKFLSVFYSPEHFRVLYDEDISSLLGHGLDELVRHHPKLKESVLKALIDMIKHVLDIDEKIEPDAMYQYSVNLHFAKAGEAVQDVKMVDPDVKQDEVKEPFLIQCIEVVARLLEGLFENTQHCREFIDLGGKDLLLRVYEIGVLPYDFASSSTSYSLSHVFRIMTDVASTEVLTSVVEKFDSSYRKASRILEYAGKDSMLAKYVDLNTSDPQKIQSASEDFKSLVSLHSYVGLLSDVYSSPVFSTAKTSQNIVQFFSEELGRRTIEQMWHFYRVCAMESLFFKAEIPRAWIYTKHKKKPDTKSESTTGDEEKDKASTTDDGKIPSSSKDKNEVADPNDRRVRNTRYIKYLLSQSTAFIVPIVKGMFLFGDDSGSHPLLLSCGSPFSWYSVRVVLLSRGSRCAETLRPHRTE